MFESFGRDHVHGLPLGVQASLPGQGVFVSQDEGFSEARSDRGDGSVTGLSPGGAPHGAEEARMHDQERPSALRDAVPNPERRDDLEVTQQPFHVVSY